MRPEIVRYLDHPRRRDQGQPAEGGRELIVRLNIPREAMEAPDPDLACLARDVEQDLDAYFVKSYQ